MTIPRQSRLIGWRRITHKECLHSPTPGGRHDREDDIFCVFGPPFRLRTRTKLVEGKPDSPRPRSRLPLIR
jgi:hypothetical protein